MQTKLHRGCGILPCPTLVASMMEEMSKRSEVNFSAKMRLGLNDKDEWKELTDILNNSYLKHLTIHPRVGKQMYKGEVDMQAFHEVYESLRLPIIYNGDITSRAEMQEMQERYPNLLGIMVGRGLLARPTMAKEFVMNKDLSDMELRNTILAMHEDMLEVCTRKYKVDSQILLHIHAFWEYMESQIERKIWKRIMKAGNLKNYLEAVKNI